ncbi:glycosyltransferase [Clostridium scatologenes]|nr:hypothetical protein [Clostridium scatologenes]
MKKLLKNIIINLMPDYKSIINRQGKSVLFSYINDGYWLKKGSKKLLTHGNKLESLVIKNIFNEFGFNFYSIRYDKKIDVKKYRKVNPKIIFGIEPNFEKLCRAYPDAIKIYYATGAYVEHQNNMVKIRTDYVNNKKQCNIPYYRMVPENNAAKLADYIIQIGSGYTIETYPKKLRNKIILIRQSSFEFLNLDIEEKKKVFDKKSYLWFGSNGSILKGLDLVLDYFKKNKNLYLHIIGSIDKEFKKVYEKELFYTQNIIYHGYIPIYDPQIVEIANKCSFIIYPSVSEGGIPGSVINMMRLGIIPITGIYASSKDIEKYGYILKNTKLTSIDNMIQETQKISDDNLIYKFKACSEYSKNNYNLKVFESDFKSSLNEVLEFSREEVL